MHNNKLFHVQLQKLLFLISIFLLLISTALEAQHTNIKVDTTGNPEEPTIVMDKNNPDHLVAGANINRVYHSLDGGFTWTERALPDSSNLQVGGDPCVIMDTAGNYYYFFLGNKSTEWLYTIGMRKASAPVANWELPKAVYPDNIHMHDKEWAAVDPATNNIYLTWTAFDQYGSSDPANKTSIMFSSSFDGGHSWTAGKEINEVMGNCEDDDNTVEGAVPAVGPNREIYVSWAGPEGIVFDRSLDSGKTWLPNDIHVDSMPGGWSYDIPGIYRANGLPVTACDRSGKQHHGNIYINWTDQRNGTDDTDVWLSRSTDGGNTWSQPHRVNNDPPGNQQFFTWMTVDQVTGYLYFVFYDRRNYNDNRTDVYMAVSKDGGLSFTNFKVSESPFLPYSSVFFGDYTNITAHNNIVRPIWTRLDKTELSLWTAIIDSTALSVDQQEDMKLAHYNNYPNPFEESTYLSFELEKQSRVSLYVFDISGKKVATLVDDRHMSRGDYTYHLNAKKYNLSPGIYFARLTSHEGVETRKILYHP